ncbi:flagellar motor switch protein FliM [Ancylobacter rudongensis]|jgi:flagellar motor switch protein FliM|uniref:Flagellar motor switch protein FliM n=1 Tax=Ancylobacter rudongensis TaxID=177413 RepID=A0A1G4ULW7_9HYPH|nr:FliM/FliN family flagellar motor switch protein [Ancylobacter rudongensis]RTM00654.1 flagellar motor switch protein FliM [Ancylobacter aquaticus]SCW94642.1 flagellar motor switch protein FliM [Ancylobacter rudongensis]
MNMRAAPPTGQSTDIRDLLLDAAGLSLDKLPMLHVIFDRMATLCAESLRQLASSQAYYSLSQVESGRIGDVLDSYEGMAIVGVFHSPEWDSHVIVGFDRDFVFSMVEVLFGADGSEPPVDDERSFSNIELRIAIALFEQMAKALQGSFALVSQVSFKFQRQETRMDFAVVGRRNNLAICAKFLLQALNRGGEMFVLIPQGALTPLRQQLASTTAGESSPRDPIWTKHIRGEVQRTEVRLRAVLEEREITLGEAGMLEVGQILPLQATPRSRVKLESVEQPLFWCSLGQAEGSYVLRIEEAVDLDQEFIDDILPR